MLNPYYAEFKDDLLDNEKILWSGKPQGGIIFHTYDIFMIPFSLMWGGFAFFWESTVIGSDAPLFFKLWGIPFVLVGLYMIFGRFIFDKKEREGTFYALTDGRVLIKSGVFNRKLTSLNLQKLSELSLTKKEDGRGTIKFGESNHMDMFANFRFNKFKDTTPKFEMIENVQSVYNEMVRLQGEKR